MAQVPSLPAKTVGRNVVAKRRSLEADPPHIAAAQMEPARRPSVCLTVDLFDRALARADGGS
jgi:hypothetical protein